MTAIRRINPILAIALISSLVTSVWAIQTSSTNPGGLSLPHTNHDIASDGDSHSASADSLPLPIDFHYKIKEKAGDALEGTKYAEIDDEFIDTEIHCEFCTLVKVRQGPTGQTGFAYASDKELDLSGAKSVKFFVMGLEGGEKMKFEVAGKSVAEKMKNSSNVSGLFKNKHFALSTEEVTLKNDWTPFSVDLSKVPREQLKGVTYPFAIEMPKIKGSQTFLIKHIVYDTGEAKLNPISATEDEVLNSTIAVASNATESSIEENNMTDTNSSNSNNNNETSSDENLAEQEEVRQSDNSTNNDTNVTNNVIDQQPPDNEDNNNNSTRSQNDNNNSTERAENEAIEENNTATNSPPTAKANDDIIAYPGDKVILDGLASSDEDENDELTYKWTQSDGPRLEISGEDTATPTLSIPSDIDEDSEATIDLGVSDGKAESQKDSVTIFIDHVEAIDEDDQQTETQELEPDNVKDSQWEMARCDSLEDCLGDGKKNTFTVAGSDGEEDIGKTNLLSFEDLELDEENVQIKYITIEVEAAKSERTGYIQFNVEHEGGEQDPFQSKAISITSGGTSEYRVILENDPVTGDEWRIDSVNSILAGYSYAGGESEVKISEMKIIVSYLDTSADSGTEAESQDVENEQDTEETDNNSTSIEIPDLNNTSSQDNRTSEQ